MAANHGVGTGGANANHAGNVYDVEAGSSAGIGVARGGDGGGVGNAAAAAGTAGSYLPALGNEHLPGPPGGVASMAQAEQDPDEFKQSQFYVAPIPQFRRVKQQSKKSKRSARTKKG